MLTNEAPRGAFARASALGKGRWGGRLRRRGLGGRRRRGRSGRGSQTLSGRRRLRGRHRLRRGNSLRRRWGAFAERDRIPQVRQPLHQPFSHLRLVLLVEIVFPQFAVVLAGGTSPSRIFHSGRQYWPVDFIPTSVTCCLLNQVRKLRRSRENVRNSRSCAFPFRSPSGGNTCTITLFLCTSMPQQRRAAPPIFTSAAGAKDAGPNDCNATILRVFIRLTGGDDSSGSRTCASWPYSQTGSCELHSQSGLNFARAAVFSLTLVPFFIRPDGEP